jgi:hypothetical protein
MNSTVPTPFHREVRLWQRPEKIATLAKCHATEIAVQSLVADEEGIDGCASLHRVGLTQHGKIYSVDYGLEF